MSNPNYFPGGVIDPDHMATAVAALVREDEHRRSSDELYGPTALRNQVRGRSAAAQVGLMRAAGLSGKRICERRRTSLGFTS